MTPEVVASLEGVAFAYGSNRVYSNLNLEVRSGITGFLGLNGAGKTTALRLLATAAKPDAGSVTVLGHRCERGRDVQRVRSSLGYLPQRATWTPSVRVDDLMHYFCWLRKVPRQDRSRAITRALELTDAAELRRRRLSELSGGQHQRVMVAQAIVHRPKLLILDEPSAGLDPEQRAELRAVLSGFACETSTLVSTHLLEDVSAMATDVIIVADGTVTFQGEVSALAERAWPGAPPEAAIEQGFLRTIRGELGG